MKYEPYVQNTTHDEIKSYQNPALNTVKGESKSIMTT